MAEKIEYSIETRYEGGGDIQRAIVAIERLNKEADKVGKSTGRAAKEATRDWGQIKKEVVGAGIAVAGFAIAAYKGYEALRAGAQLQTTTERFGKLATQINTTADALLGKLRTATQGMISDAELMASASGIISLRLADNQEQVVRLATVVGTLGWDMQQVILTFANLSTMRLDALGLSVDEVKAKQRELMEQGMSTAAAFKEAVIQAGEARLEVGGVSEAEQSFKQAETAVANFKNEVLLSSIALGEQIGLFQEMSAIAGESAAMRGVIAQLAEMRESGQITTVQWLGYMDQIAGGTDAAAIQAQLSQVVTRDALTDTADELNDQLGAWQLWARQVSIQTGNAAQTAAQNMNAIFTGLIGLRDGLGANAAFTPRQDDFDYMAAGADIGGQRALIQRQTERMRNAMRRSWAADDERAAQVAQEEASLRSYGGAVGYVSAQEQELAATHQRMVSAFQAEIGAAAAEGLIGEDGAVKVDAMNQALYRQVEVAGASAATLALLGVATGQFTEEQAEAALKAAILQEQINQIAESVVAGKLTIDQALGQLGEASTNLNQADLITVAQGVGAAPEEGRTVDVEANVTGVETAVTTVQTSLNVLTDEPYLATLDANIEGVLTGADRAKRALEGVPSAVTVTVNWNQVGGDLIGALMRLGIL